MLEVEPLCGQKGVEKRGVYAICKNELQFVDRWVKSMKEADEIVVLDTGSEDGTVERLRELGVTVEQKVIKPWRFDVARNASMQLAPKDADILVCTDLDEVLTPGWRDILEKAWTPQAKQARYRYVWNFNEDGSEGTVFQYEKIHANGGFKWVHPVHEVLIYDGKEPHAYVNCSGFQLNHLPDPTKSRAQYLPLLELAVEERPDDDRNVHYLGREYMFRQDWNRCIETLERHLKMPTATWRDERCASMRFIARAHWNLGHTDQAMEWYFKAIGEAPYLREPYVEMARLLYGQNNWSGVVFFVDQALRIEKRAETYICEADAWGSLPHDLISIALYNMNYPDLAAKAGREALKLSPDDERIRKNLELFETATERR
ncbi:MAG TPA: glycosyltransferase [Clostridia bacterium]|nr:glycosyltransferase [Clostridia bacterium]